MSQNAEILNHLKHGPITPIEALKEYDVFRLAARIGELREKHEIGTRRVVRKGKRFAQYFLIKECKQ